MGEKDGVTGEEKVTGCTWQDPASGAQRLTRLCLSFLLMSPRARQRAGFSQSCPASLESAVSPRGLRRGLCRALGSPGCHLLGTSHSSDHSQEESSVSPATKCERCPGGGQGNPLQCSRLEKPLPGDPGGLQSTGPQRVGHDGRAHTSTVKRQNKP